MSYDKDIENVMACPKGPSNYHPPEQKLLMKMKNYLKNFVFRFLNTQKQLFPFFI